MAIFKPVLILAYLNLFLLPFSSRTDVQEVPVYNGADLGVNYTPAGTTFKVWAPDADEVRLRLYDAGEGGHATFDEGLTRNEGGVWVIAVTNDIKNKYYTFQVKQNGILLQEAPDIYAKAVGVNGRRGMVVDLKATNPAGWESDKKPLQKNFTDAVIYETHIRDISVSDNSGIVHKGKFLGLAETGTKNTAGQSTGLDHLKELGVTHVHLLPSFDYNTVDETKLNEKQYNWGYDPLNYNVPEGSYSTNPYDGNVRIKEFKQMVQTLHTNGLRVILDVVYNHTSDAEHSNFNQFAPGYFYRMNADGTYSNGTGCGNETASEKQMMRNFMVQSVVYWAKEYHLDGFRFDLMGVHDIETMNAISDALHKIDPTIFIYGEGWTAGNTPLPEQQRAIKKNTYQLHQIAAFDDDMRDGLKGGWSDVKAKGFVSGAPGNAESVKFGIVAATSHPQVNYQAVNYSKSPWAAQPYQCINYVSCHDDNTLFDRLKISNPNATEDELIRMDKLSNAVVLTSQGVFFLHSGAELLRSKQGVANSYNSPDAINEIDWSRKTKYEAVFNYYKQMIWLRRNHPAFRMPSTQMISKHLSFTDTADPCLIVYQIKGNANGDQWKNILVVINGNTASRKVKLPQGNWTLVGDENKVDEKGIRTGIVNDLNIQATALYILHD